MHIDDPKLFAGRLRRAREQTGLSQRGLAFPGCTAAYLSRLEAGQRVPSLQIVSRLAARLGVSAQWLATGVAAGDDPDLVDAEVALRLGELEEARRLYEARRDEPSALAGLGQLAFREERLDEAVGLLEQALARRPIMEDPAAVETLARAYAFSGAMENALALLEEALDAARADGSPADELRFAVLLANALMDRGAFADAERMLARVIRLTAQMRDPTQQARLYWSQSRLHVQRGESLLAARYARRALDILEGAQANAYVAMAYHLLAFAEIETGNGEGALGLLADGRELFGPDMTERDDAKFALEEARALLSLRRKRQAARAAARALQLLDAIDPGDRGRAYVALGDVFAGVGDRNKSRDLYEKGFELLTEQGKPYAVAAARRLAEILSAEGDSARALAVLMEATAVAD